MSGYDNMLKMMMCGGQNRKKELIINSNIIHQQKMNMKMNMNMNVQHQFIQIHICILCSNC